MRHRDARAHQDHPDLPGGAKQLGELQFNLNTMSADRLGQPEAVRFRDRVDRVARLERVSLHSPAPLSPSIASINARQSAAAPAHPWVFGTHPKHSLACAYCPQRNRTKPVK